MDPVIISWIILVFAAGAAGKFAGLVLPGGALGLVGNPIFGIVGGVIAVQGLGAAELIDPVDYITAGIGGFAGGFVLVAALSMLKKIGK